MVALVENSPVAWSERAERPTSWDAALWSERGQTRRFLAVLRHLNLEPGNSVLDFGCGTGRFGNFLPGDVEYHAHDWAGGMLERVRREHPSAHVLDEMPARAFDHVVAIGTFNLRDGWTEEQTWDRLGALWVLHTRRTLVASLHRGADQSTWDYEPEAATELARRLGVVTFAIDATYLDNDFLLVMHR